MPDMILSAQLDAMKSWASELPRQVTQVLGDREVTTRFGDRHGSWLLRVSWVDGSLVKVADLAMTNSGATPDASATSVVISTVAGATNESRFARETLFEERRALGRLADGFLEDQLIAAVTRAATMTETSLTYGYETGLATTTAEA